MRIVKWLKDETAHICGLEMGTVEVSPDMTLDDIRERYPQTYQNITDRIEYYRAICEQHAAVDYGGSYESWLKKELDGCGRVMAEADSFHTYMLYNEKRRVCQAELKRLETATTAPIDSEAAQHTAATMNGGESEQERPTRHFNSTIDDDTLLWILEALTTPDSRGNRYLAADTTAAAWLYVCKGTPTNEPVKPLNWLADQNELALLVDVLLGTYWEAAKACFRIKGKEPNTRAMATDRSNIRSGKKDEPKKHKKLLNIISINTTARKN